MTRTACQLLTAIDDGEKAATVLLDPTYAVQQKFDGKRIILHIERSAVTAYNRDALQCEISHQVLSQGKELQQVAPMILDGEWLRETKSFHVFDFLEFDRDNLRFLPFRERQHRLQTLFNAKPCANISPVRTEYDQPNKLALLDAIHRHNLEGVVLKEIHSPYEIGRRPNQFKYKFTAVSSFVITRLNEKQSVALGAYDSNGHMVNCGDVKIRNSRFKVAEGIIVDVKYMHCFAESNLIYQPRMVRLRDDLTPEACTLTQLRYKGTELTVV